MLQAVAASRALADQATHLVTSVDDEHSLSLPLGYAAAAPHLAIAQLAERTGLAVDETHPFVCLHIPGGALGRPAAWRWARQQAFGPHALFFAEPVQSPRFHGGRCSPALQRLGLEAHPIRFLASWALNNCATGRLMAWQSAACTGAGCRRGAWFSRREFSTVRSETLLCHPVPAGRIERGCRSSHRPQSGFGGTARPFGEQAMRVRIIWQRQKLPPHAMANANNILSGPRAGLFVLRRGKYARFLAT